MDAQDFQQAFISGDEAEQASLLARLTPVVDRGLWSVVAGLAYIDQPSAAVRDAASTFFRLCAVVYAERVSPSFHMVPWDSAQLFRDDDFGAVYERAHGLTDGFQGVTPERIAAALGDEPRSLVVFRTMAAYSRQHVSYLLDKQFGIRLSPDDLRAIEQGGVGSGARLLANWRAACESLGQLIYLAVRGELLPFREGVELDKFRPLTDKIDTREGWDSVARVAADGLPYSALLYQRYVGSAFGLAINASTSLKGDLLEGPVARLFKQHRVPFYRVGTREAVPGWEQAPDFFIPDTTDPRVVIESKIAEDGGTARDKASRIERLSRLTYARGITLISVIDGLGFLRINDVLAPILGNSKGLVFTHDDLPEMLEVPALKVFVGTAPTS